MSLIAATKLGSVEDVKRLLDSKANPNNEKDPQNQTALHVAAGLGMKDIVSLLIQKYKKLDVNKQDNQGWSPLLCAIHNGHYEVCEILLSTKTIKAHIPNNDYNTPLIYLCKRKPQSDVETAKYKYILSLLISKGIDVNERNNFGETALHYATMSHNHDAIDFLHQNNANINAINNRGETPLHYSILSRDPSIVDKILKHGGDPNVTAHDGKPLLSLVSDPQIISSLENATSHRSVIIRNMDSFKKINDQLVEALTELDAIQSHLNEKKTDVRKSVDNLRTVQKFGSVGRSARKAHKHLAFDLEVFDRMNGELHYARSGNWLCCVYRNQCKDDMTTSNIFQSLCFIEDVQHESILPVIQLRRFMNEVQMFVCYPSTNLTDYLSQERYSHQNEILPAETVTKYALKIAKGLEYLHTNGIVHRALQSSQIFLLLGRKGKSPKLVISPFFLAKEDDLWPVSESNYTFYNGPVFRAPETRIGNIYSDVSCASDIWSFGIVLYHLLSLQNPNDQAHCDSDAAPVLPIHFQSQRSRKRASVPENRIDIDVAPYHPLIDLFRVCTNIDPTQRPSITEIVKALSNNINIKEMCGLAVSRGPGSLKDWIEMNHTFTKITDIENSAIIKQTPNFKIEAPLPEGVSNPCYIQYIDKDFAYYAKHLAQLPHENYTALSPLEEVALVSIEVEGQYVGDQWNYKALIRTKEEDIRVVIVCENAKDRIRTLKQHPTLIDFNLQLLKEPSVKDALIDFERKHLEPKTYKFGIIYRKPGQVCDDDMYSNEHGSPDFEHFLSFLGEKIPLQGWTHFRGGLDTASNTTGKESLYTKFGDFEIMFHTSTLLPYDRGNPQQLHRKRHIGNDVIVIIFQDQDADPFTPCEFASHFNHVFCVVQVHHKVHSVERGETVDDSLRSTSRGKLRRASHSSPILPSANSPLKVVNPDVEKVFYQISFTFKDSVKERARPFLQEPCIFADDEDFRELFLTKLINCERVSMRSEQFEKRLRNVRGQLLTHLNDEILAKEAEGKRRGTLWFS